MSRRDRKTLESDDNVIILSPPPQSSPDDDSDAIFVTPVVEDVIVTPVVEDVVVTPILMDDEVIITPSNDDTATASKQEQDFKREQDIFGEQNMSEQVDHDFSSSHQEDSPDVEAVKAKAKADDTTIDGQQPIKGDMTNESVDIDNMGKEPLKGSPNESADNAKANDKSTMSGKFKPEPSEEEIQAIMDEMLFEEEMAKLKAEMESDVSDDTNNIDTDKIIDDEHLTQSNNSDEDLTQSNNEIDEDLTQSNLDIDEDLTQVNNDIDEHLTANLEEQLLQELLQEDDVTLDVPPADPYTSISDMEKDLDRYLSEIDRVMSERERIDKMQRERKEKDEQLRREREQRERQRKERQEQEREQRERDEQERERDEYEENERRQREQMEREDSQRAINREQENQAKSQAKQSEQAKNDDSERIAHLESIINQLIAEREGVRNNEPKDSAKNPDKDNAEKVLTSKLDKLEDMLKDFKTQQNDNSSEYRKSYRNETPPVQPNTAQNPEDAFIGVFRKWFEGEMLSKIQTVFSGKEQTAATPPPTAKVDEAKEDNSDLVRVGDNLYYNKKDNKTYSFMVTDTNLPAVVKTEQPTQQPAPARRVAPTTAPRRRPAPRRRAPIYSVRPVGRRPARPGARPSPRRPR